MPQRQATPSDPQTPPPADTPLLQPPPDAQLDTTLRPPNSSLRPQGRATWGQLSLHPEDRHNAKSLNPLLQRIWDSKDRLSWIIGRVILQELGMTVREYCDNSSGLKTAELYHLLTPISKKSLRQGFIDRALSTMLKDWTTLAKANQGTPLEPILKEGAAKLANAAIRSEPSPVACMLRSWRLRSYDAFESSWGAEYRNFRKQSPGRFLPLSLRELISVAKGAGLIPKKLSGKELWNHPVTKEARKAFLAEATARQATPSAVDLAMRLDFAGYGTSADTLRAATDLKAAGLTWNAARDIIHFDPVKAEAAEPVLEVFRAKKLFGRGDLNKLREGLSHDYSQASLSVGFSQLVTAELQRIGIALSDIAEALAVPKPPGTSLGPADCVRLAIAGSGFQKECPPGVLALFAARSEPHFHELLSVRRREIVRELGLRRGAREPCALRVERTLWGIGVEQIGVPKQLIENLEWGRRAERPSLQQEREACERIRNLGLARAKDALLSYVERVQLGTTAETISRLGSLSGGIGGIAAKSHVSLGRAARFTSKQDVPPLPLFRDILAGHGVPWSPTVLRRWCLDAAAREELLQPNAAARCLKVEILSRSSDVTNLLRLLPKGSELTEPLRRFLRGIEIPPPQLAQLLAGLGVEPSSARHDILLSIAREQDAVRGVQKWLTSLPQKSQATWKRAIRDLAAVVKADLEARSPAVPRQPRTVQELISLNREARFSVDLSFSAALQSQEQQAGPIMEMLAGLSAREIVALSEELSAGGQQISRDAQPHAHRALADKLTQLSLTPAKLSPILVNIFVKSGLHAKPGLFTAIEYALKEGRISGVTPYAVLASLVAADRAEFERLLEAERVRILQHAGGRLPAGTVEAQLWGLLPKDLWDAGIKISASQAVSEVRKRGLDLCEHAFRELLPDYSLGLSRALVKSCMYRSGRIGHDFSRGAGVKISSVSSFLRGERTLDWRRFHKLLSSANVEPDGLAKLWWRLDTAKDLKTDPRGLTDCQRVGAALLLEGNGQLASLLGSRYSKTQVHEVRRVLRLLENGRYSTQRMAKIRRALKIDPKSQRGIFLEQVFRTGSIAGAISTVLRSSMPKRSTSPVENTARPLHALSTLLEEEAKLMRGVEGPRPQLEPFAAFRNYAAAPLAPDSCRDIAALLHQSPHDAFPGATREELLLAFGAHVPGADKPLRASRDQQDRGWENSLEELAERLGLDFDSIEVNHVKQELHLGGDVISARHLSDALFGIDRPTVRPERVKIMRIRLAFDLPVFHPGDHSLMLEEDVPIDGSQPDRDDEDAD